jgi:PAS domain S-box-containing protein
VVERTRELEASMLQVRDLAERMELAIEAAQMGACDWDILTQKIIWNDYHVKLLGYTPGAAEYSYADWERRVHPEDLPRVNTAIEQAMATQTDYSSEYRVIWADGSIHWLNGFGRFYYNLDGQPIRMTGVAEDITDRKQSELALAASEERFRATFEQAAVGFAHVGLAGQWLQVNQKICDIVGYTEAELLTKTFQDITYPEDLSTDLEYLHQLLGGEIQTYTMEKRYIHKSGKIVWVNLTVSLRWDNSGAPIYFISVVEDISDRKQAEFELQEKTLQLAETALLVKQRNQELDQFTHIVSHDLKAPLRAIANLATWIEDDLEGQIPAETQEHLALMRSRVYRMEALINGLLEYARVGNTPANLATFSLEDLLTEIIDTLSIPSSFTIDLPANLPTITTNRLLLSQVWANLLGNACKHHDRSDGRIKVGAQPQGAIWTFTVADDGPGIAPGNQDRVFDVFQTLAPRDRQENTGIGLSIVKKIVESQGGNITLESEIGRGTTFRFTWMVDERKV